MSNSVIEFTSLPANDEKIFILGETYAGHKENALSGESSLEPTVFELLNAAKSLTTAQGPERGALSENKISVILVGAEVLKHAEKLIAHGADRVYLIEDEALGDLNDENIASVAYELLAARSPEIVMAGATHLGRTVMPRIAAKFKTGLSSDVTSLSINADGVLEQTKPAFKDMIQAVIVCPDRRPQMTTVRPKVFKQAEEDTSRSGEIVYIKPDPSKVNSRARLVEVMPKAHLAKSLTDAKIVIGVGRGIGTKDNLDLIQELADLLGAEIGATRPLTDEGYFGHDHQIGQSGIIIEPDIYIACGISGALQHTVGIARAKMIIAINKDPEAPIFKIAHYGVVGDIFEVIPNLIKQLRS